MTITAPPTRRPSDPTRARQPDASGFIERDGVRVAWERFGDAGPTILLMPTWSIFPSRLWKLQAADLARRFRVVTFDGRGNGASDRPTERSAYADTAFVADAAAVLDAAGCDRAVVVGLSMGAGFTIRFALDQPARTLAIVLIGPTLGALDRPEGTPDVPDEAWFEEPRDPDEDDGWGRYNAVFWRDRWPDFADWFVGTRIFSEPHSTKPIEDGIRWALDTDGVRMAAARRAPYLTRPSDWPLPPSTEGRAIPFLRRLQVPALVIHGSDDRIIPIAVGRRVAAELGADLVEIQGGGHAPNLREPVRANLLIRDFALRVTGRTA